MTGGTAYPQRSGRIEGVSWTLHDAGRAPSGLGLGYFVCDDAEVADRRTALPAGVDVRGLDDEAFRALWEAGRELTCTERRIVDPHGLVWLAQSVGPVWAEGGTAAGTLGVRLRCVSAERPVLELNGVTLSEVADADLIARAGALGGVTPSSD